ncbi:MAG: hypothetical protein EBX40_04290 [Gammaproteobacteria bacterium]|nr:hypothetical protein [Gammaproteobacteria bacterium]
MPRPLHLSTRLISFHETDLARKDELQSSLLAIPGVGVAEVSMNEQVAYLKVDTQQLKEEDLAKWQKVH